MIGLYDLGWFDLIKDSDNSQRKASKCNSQKADNIKTAEGTVYVSSYSMESIILVAIHRIFIAWLNGVMN